MSEEHWTDQEADRREAMAHEVHGVYCMQYLLNEGKPYWTNGDYSRLEEKVKNFDRALVAWHLTKFEAMRDKLNRIENLLHALPHEKNCVSALRTLYQPPVCDCWKKELV